MQELQFALNQKDNYRKKLCIVACLLTQMKARLFSVTHKPSGISLVHFSVFIRFPKFCNGKLILFSLALADFQDSTSLPSCEFFPSLYTGGVQGMIRSLLILQFPSNRMPQEYCNTVVVCLKNVLDLDLYDSDKSGSNIIVFAQYLFRQNSHWLQQEFCLTKHCGIFALSI